MKKFKYESALLGVADASSFINRKAEQGYRLVHMNFIESYKQDHGHGKFHIVMEKEEKEENGV